MRTKFVTEGTQRRERLTNIWEKKKLDLEKQHEEVRDSFEEEKKKVF